MKMTIHLVVGALLLVSLTGCATILGGGGKSGTRFNADLTRIYDASLDLLEDEKLPVVRKMLTPNMAQVVSEYPDGSTLRIVAKATSSQYTETIITAGVAGDNYRAYELMKKLEDRVK